MQTRDVLILAQWQSQQHLPPAERVLDDYEDQLAAVSEAMTEDRHVWDDTNQRWLEGKMA